MLELLTKRKRVQVEGTIDSFRSLIFCFVSFLFLSFGSTPIDISFIFLKQGVTISNKIPITITSSNSNKLFNKNAVAN